MNAERLGTHVAKGYGEGLFITSACSHANLWAVIMDAGTRYTGQVGGWGGPCPPAQLPTCRCMHRCCAGHAGGCWRSMRAHGRQSQGFKI